MNQLWLIKMYFFCFFNNFFFKIQTLFKRLKTFAERMTHMSQRFTLTAWEREKVTLSTQTWSPSDLCWSSSFHLHLIISFLFTLKSALLMGVPCRTEICRVRCFVGFYRMGGWLLKNVHGYLESFVSIMDTDLCWSG